MQLHTGIIRRCGQSFLRSRLKEYHLKPLDSVVMHTLQKKGSCNQETLCSTVDIDKGRMARIMDRLEQSGLVQRVVNRSDKRAKLVALTDDGLKMLETIDSIFSDWDEICFTGFSGEERQQYHDFLERISQNAAAWKEN